MMAALNFEPNLIHRYAHSITQIGLLINRGDREITALDRGLITKVAAFFLATGVPICFIGIDFIEHGIGLYLVTDILKDEKLGFRSKERGIGNTCGLQVCFSAFGYTARVTVVGLTGAGIHDRADNNKGFFKTERINIRRLNIRNKLHIRLGNALETTNRRAIEKLTVDEEILVDRLRRKVKVLLHPGHIGESNVDEDNFVALNKIENFLGTGKHTDCSSWCFVLGVWCGAQFMSCAPLSSIGGIFCSVVSIMFR